MARGDRGTAAELRRGCADRLLAWKALRDRMGVGKVLAEELGRLTFRIPEKREAGDMEREGGHRRQKTCPSFIQNV